MKKTLIIGGPTAVGKSEVACLVAKRVGGEVISADSMSVYVGMDIGTAKPRTCLREVKHHLIDILSPGDVFDAKLFEELALRCVKDIIARGRIPLVVGGTYLYIQALLYGIPDTPPPDWKLRGYLYRIAQKRGSAYLYRKLVAIDPLYAQKVHENDLRRVVRALEVFIQTGKPFSSFHRWEKPRMSFVGFFLRREWKSIERRIEERVRWMIKHGLVEEVRKLVGEGFGNFLTSSQAIGYKELVPYVEGRISLEEATDKIIKRTKEYAKRQVRWFRKRGWHEINLEELSPEKACEKILTLADDTALSLSPRPAPPS
ncbi:MAG TPA: tRNA (adenosine(37)-N6)-dimethylallyltransferase MiaA [Aquificaceae bacterium]|nr:tRNA (adenosine(37)-N6)-dimethylallyltransferase MiaA [Aquificaceae bacterium]